MIPTTSEPNLGTPFPHPPSQASPLRAEQSLPVVVHRDLAAVQAIERLLLERGYAAPSSAPLTGLLAANLMGHHR